MDSIKVDCIELIKCVVRLYYNKMIKNDKLDRVMRVVFTFFLACNYAFIFAVFLVLLLYHANPDLHYLLFFQIMVFILLPVILLWIWCVSIWTRFDHKFIRLILLLALNLLYLPYYSHLVLKYRWLKR